MAPAQGQGDSMQDLDARLINELEELLPDTIKSFYISKKSLYSIGGDSIRDVITQILSDIYPMAKMDVVALYDSETQNFVVKKNSWTKKARKNYSDFDIGSEQSFFRDAIRMRLYDKDSCMSRYGTFEPEKIAEQIVGEIDQWKKNGQYLIDFPTFPDIGKIRPVNVFLSDVRLALLRIIIREYAGNIHNWSVKQPKAVLSSPIFSGQSGSVSIQEENQKYYAPIFSSENYMVRISNIDPEIVSANIEAKIPVYDQVDMDIVSFLLNNTEYDIKNLMPESRQVTTLTAIAAAAFHVKHPRTEQKEAVINRLNKLHMALEIRDQQTGYYANWVLLDTVEVLPPDESGVQQVNYVLGTVMREQTIQKKLVSIPRSSYNMVRTGYGRTLYYSLQLQRIHLASMKGKMEATYTLGYFTKAMLLRYKSPSRIKKIVVQALDELLATDILEKYTVKGSEFTLFFKPFRQEELKYLLEDTENTGN